MAVVTAPLITLTSLVTALEVGNRHHVVDCLTLKIQVIKQYISSSEVVYKGLHISGFRKYPLRILMVLHPNIVIEVCSWERQLSESRVESHAIGDSVAHSLPNK